ncbi:hypothetical protein, partial [Escherichia coli]|uniref:hypothetical protein n=1 Tax=Escherichia coli TaxID=562 RepID=UPI000CAFA505
MATRQPRQEDRKSPLDDLNLADTAVFGFSWMLVMAVGLMPIVEASLKRSPSISIVPLGKGKVMPGAISTGTKASRAVICAVAIASSTVSSP